MSDSEFTCTNCNSALPDGAAFCPGCGTATPTGVVVETGAVAVPDKADTSEADFRERLQRALGEGFELRELIGRGGFGVVYAALDKNLKREVAIKALRFDLFPTESLMGRFRREAESVAKLRHPNVVPIYTIGQAEGFAYFIMPRLEGTNLADFFNGETQLSIREAHRVFRELAGALAAAHRAGIIHRDIKPENVFLENPERRALLMDFGIAKTDDDVDAGKLTGTGMIVGTPHYMSPEQAAGERHIDHRSDIYSLGVVAYQLFSGKTPFKETTSQKIIVERLTTIPDDLAIGNPAVPEDIAAAVMRCLEREPDDRWNSMANLISVLDTVEVPEDEDAELALIAATPIEPPKRTEWIGLLVAAVGLMAGWVATYGIHSAPAIDNPVVTKSEAERIAGDYLVGLDDAGTFAAGMLGGALNRSTGYNRAPNATRQFLLEALGFEEAARRVQMDLPVSDWRIRWRDLDGSERWDVRVGSDGDVKEFTLYLDADEPGAKMSEDQARAVADSFLVRQQWDPVTLELRAARSQRESQRTDHFFTWRDRAHAIPWTSDDGEVDSAFVELSVDVSGDRVTRYQRELQRPVDFSTTSVSNTIGIIIALLILGVTVYGFGLALAQKRRRFVRWRPAVIITCIVMVLSVATWVNGIPAGLHSGDNASVGAYILQDGANDLLGLLFIGVGLVMLAMGAVALARDVFPAHAAAWEKLMSGRSQLQTLGPVVLGGYLAGFLMVALGDMANLLVWPLAKTTFTGESGYLENVTDLAPFLDVSAGSAAIGIPMALAALYALALGRHLFKSTTAAVVAPTVIILLVSLPIIISGETGPIGGALAVLVLVLAVLRFGVLAGAIAATLMVAESGLDLIASGQGSYVASGLIGWVLLLLPGVIVGVAYVRGRPVTLPAS